MASIKVAAVQMWAEVGAISKNLASAEKLVNEAFRRGAQWVSHTGNANVLPRRS